MQIFRQRDRDKEHLVCTLIVSEIGFETKRWSGYIPIGKMCFQAYKRLKWIFGYESKTKYRARDEQAFKGIRKTYRHGSSSTTTDEKNTVKIMTN